MTRFIIIINRNKLVGQRFISFKYYLSLKLIFVSKIIPLDKNKKFLN